MVTHFRSYQNSMFTTFLQYFKNKLWRDEVDFLHADKDKNFLQIDFNTLVIKGFHQVILLLLLLLMGNDQAFSKYSLSIL